MVNEISEHQSHDFVIVGSGAGGGPLAANLALAGFTVLLIEAGEDDINDNYKIPALHPRSSEDPKFSWEFFVKHYDDDNNPERDPKHHPKPDDNEKYPLAPGIFYPRATGLGGCTTHHAMITIYPHESDWNNIAKLVGDNSWNAKNMRKYFDERIANPQYENGSKLLKLLKKPDPIKLLETLDPIKLFKSPNPLAKISGIIKKIFQSNHGEDSSKDKWLSISQADPILLAGDIHGIFKVVLAAFKTAIQDLKPMPELNPNHPDVAKNNLEGINVIPLSVDKGQRVGSRERIKYAQDELKNRTQTT